MSAEQRIRDALPALLEKDRRYGWEDGLAGEANIVCFNGEDIAGVCRIDYEPRRQYVLSVNPKAIAELLAELDRLRATQADAAEVGEDAAAVQGAWRDIATAAHSGRDILVYTDDGRTRLAFYDEARGGVWSCWPGREALTPTHWMPLPAAPADSSMGGGER